MRQSSIYGTGLLVVRGRLPNSPSTGRHVLAHWLAFRLSGQSTLSFNWNRQCRATLTPYQVLLVSLPAGAGTAYRYTG